eukprot:m51a1_g11482 hypothetical protein (380) ;mRNA; f:9245-10384
MRVGYDFGSEEDFQYTSNTTEILTACTLFVKLAPLEASGGGKNPRYVDDILCAAIERIEWIYGGTTVQVLYGDEIHFSTLQETADVELDRKYRDQAAGLSDQERTVKAMDTQTVRLDIPWWWTKPNTGHWHSHCLGRPLKIRIRWRSPQFLLQQDIVNQQPMPKATTSLVGRTYILDKWLRFETSIPTEATKDVYRKKIEACGDHGWLQLFKDMQIQHFDIAAGSYGPGRGPVVLKTDIFNRYGYNLRFFVRPRNNLVSNFLNNNRWEVLDVDGLQFDIQTKVFYPHIDDVWAKRAVNAHKFLGNPEIPIYNVPLCAYPDMHQQAMGGIEFANITMPYLKVDLPNYNTDLTITVTLFVHNYIREVIDGQQSALETVQNI